MVQEPRKNVSIFQEGGSTPAPPTPLVIRVVLLHIEHFVQSFNSSTVYVLSLGSRAITVHTYYLKRQVCKIAVFYQHETSSLPKYMHACIHVLIN